MNQNTSEKIGGTTIGVEISVDHGNRPVLTKLMYIVDDISWFEGTEANSFEGKYLVVDCLIDEIAVLGHLGPPSESEELIPSRIFLNKGL